MGFKSKQVAIGTSDTDIYQMGTGLAGVAVVSVGNQTSGAITFTVKVFKQSTGVTTTIVTSQSAPANKIGKIDPIALEAGDKIVMNAASGGTTASVLVTDSASSAPAAGLTPRGDYSSGATYATNDLVAASDGGSYVSMQDGNINHDPTASPTYWMVNAKKGDLGSLGAVSIKGLITGNNASDTNNDIDISVGSARDSTDTYTLTLASGLTKRLDAAWAAGTNQGGLDTGSKANSTSYHIFIIRKDADSSCDVLFSASPISPTMPSGYTAKRRIGSIKTDGSGNIYGYVQKGGFFTLKAPTSQSVSSPGTIALTTATQLPQGTKYRASLLVAVGATSFSAAGYSMVRDPDLGVPSVVDANTGVVWLDEAKVTTEICDVWCNASAQFYTGSAVTTGPILFFVVKGWFDPRDEY